MKRRQTIPTIENHLHRYGSLTSRDTQTVCVPSSSQPTILSSRRKPQVWHFSQQITTLLLIGWRIRNERRSNGIRPMRSPVKIKPTDEKFQANHRPFSPVIEYHTDQQPRQHLVRNIKTFAIKRSALKQIQRNRVRCISSRWEIIDWHSNVSKFVVTFHCIKGFLFSKIWSGK